MTAATASKAWLKDFISAHGVVHGDKEDLLGRDGRKLAWLLDLRPLFLDPEGLEKMAELFWAARDGKGPLLVAGMESAAVPLVTAIILEGKRRGIECKGIYVRKERKTSGRARLIEGEVVAGWPVVIVDDVVNSGDSVEQVRVVLANEGLVAKDVWCVVDYQSSGGLAWRAGQGVSVESVLALDDFGLKLESDGVRLVYAYAPKWQYKAAKGWAMHIVPRSLPVVVPVPGGELLVYGTDDGLLHAVEAETGKLRWQHRAKGVHRKGIWSSPAYHDGRVFYGAYNGNVYCLDAQSGREVWSVQAADWVGSSPCVIAAHGTLAIGLEYERPGTQGGNAVLRMSDGGRVWEAVQKAYQHGSAAYAPRRDWIIWGNADHDITAYNAVTGAVVWTVATARSIKYPCLVDEARDLVVGGDFGGTVYFVRLSDGKLLGTVETGNMIYGLPVLVGACVWIGSADRHLYAIEVEGLKVRHKVDLQARVLASPVAVPGVDGKPDTVMVGTTRGRVVEVDVATGKVIGQVMLPDSVTNGVVVLDAGRMIVVRGCMGELYALQRMGMAGV